MKVLEYLCETRDAHTGKWVRSRHYYTLDEIAALSNSRPVMASEREGHRTPGNEWRSHSTGFSGPPRSS